jgi:hypothetical protein
MNDLPEAEWLLTDRGYDADWFREALQSWVKVSQENRQV